MLDAVVVNYNAGKDLYHLLTALEHPEVHLTLVDNASTDGSLDMAKSLANHCIENDDNLGFAQACNQGAAVGESNVLAFINPDCQTDAQTLCDMALALVRSDHGLMGCRVVNPDGSIQRGTWRRSPTLWRVLKTVIGLETFGLKGVNLNREPMDVTAVNGACFLIKRDVFESVGGFDTDFPLHFEDLDLFARVQKSGHTLGYLNDTEVKHIKGLSSKDSRQIKKWKKQGLLRYFKKHRPRWEGWVIRLLSALR